MKGWNQSLYKVVACATLLLGLASCSGGDGGGGGGTPPAASPTTGTFVDSLVDGLHFTSPPLTRRAALPAVEDIFNVNLVIT